MRKISIVMVIAALFLSGCGFGASETSGFKGGKTEYKDVPTEITSFMWQEWSDMPVHGYLIERRSSGNCICLEGNVNERESMTEWDIDDSVMDELADWVDDYNIREWDGFDMDKDDRVPSAGFELVIELGTGEKINATGKNVYPKDYDAARNYLTELLSDMPLAANEKSADKEASDGGYTSTYYEEDNYSEPVRSDDLGDMDGDGINEYVEYQLGHLEFMLDGVSIFKHDEPILYVMGTGGSSYADLDGDGKEEIFFSFYPSVNSMPLTEFAVLKQDAYGWTAIDKPLFEGDNYLNVKLPFKGIRISKDEMEVSLEGYDDTLTVDIGSYFKDQIAQFKEEGDEFLLHEFEGVYNGKYGDEEFPEGCEFGYPMEWGIWEIDAGTYDGKNCLVATEGICGPYGKDEFFGVIKVYFDYTSDGKRNILNMEFTPYELY